MSASVPTSAPGRPKVRVATSSGSIQIVAEPRRDLEVASGGAIERRPSTQDDEIDVRRSDSVEIRCPDGADVVAGTSSGSVRLSGLFGDVRVTSQSGSIDVDDVASADLRTTSGDVRLETCIETCRVTTTSGEVRVGQAGDADVRGGSGTVRASARTARVRTVSGTIDLDVGGDAIVEAVSGAVTVLVPPHVHPRVVTLGQKRPHIRLVEGDDCEISVRSVSGDVTVRTT